MEVKWEFSAGGVVFKKENNKVLVLLIRVKKRWSFPKGNIERNEKKEEAALREVKEETGIEAEIIDYLGDIEYWYYLEGYKIHKFVYYYLMKYKSGEITPQKEEIDEARFVEIKDCYNLLSYDKDKNVLKKAEEKLKNLGILE
jgi:8-oxo-dGTP diphosphatase